MVAAIHSHSKPLLLHILPRHRLPADPPLTTLTGPWLIGAASDHTAECIAATQPLLCTQRHSEGENR